MAGLTLNQFTDIRTPLVDTDVIPIAVTGETETKKTILSTLATWIGTKFFALTGGTISGDLTINKSGPNLWLRRVGSSAARFIAFKDGAARWTVHYGTSEAESGSDSGSNFLIEAINDADTIATPSLKILRSNSLTTFGGSVIIAKSDPEFTINQTGTGAVRIIGQKASANRWRMSLGDADAESGSDTGTNFRIERVTDAGAANVAIRIRRNTGLMELAGDPTVNLGAATKQYVDAHSSVGSAPFDALAYNGMQLNGSCDISQEKGSNGTTFNSTYIMDGWVLGKTSTGVVTGAQASSTLHFPGFPNFLEITVGTAGPGTPAAGDFVFAQQRIEGYRMARLGCGKSWSSSIAIGFWHKHIQTGTYSVSVQSSVGPDRSYCTTYQQVVSDTAEYTTIVVPPITDGTWSVTNTTGLFVNFTMACGSTKTAPSADSWQTGDYVAAPGQVNGIAATTDKFRITGVVILPGIGVPTAAQSPSILRPYNEELTLAMRYYETSYVSGSIPGTTTTAGSESDYVSDDVTKPGRWFIPFVVPKRAGASGIAYSTSTGTAFKVFNVTTAADLTGSSSMTSPNARGMYLGLGGGATAGQALRWHWVADCRL